MTTFAKRTFFRLYADHLQRLEGTIRSFIVTTSPELWFSTEAAALIDRSRAELHIPGYKRGRGAGAGGDSTVPNWFVGAERRKVDVLVQSDTKSIGIQFKMIHNNKNFWNRVAQLRAEILDGSPTIYDTPASWLGVAVFVYHAFSEDQSWIYQYLRDRRDETRASRSACIKYLKDGLWKGTDPSDTRRLRCVDEQKLFDLDGANYTESGRGASVWLSLWVPQR